MMFGKKSNKITGSKILPVLFAIICIALPIIAMAQGPDDPNDVPLDGGLSLLIAAGSAYGIKKYRNYKASVKEK
jgi:hypothetical protein